MLIESLGSITLERIKIPLDSHDSGVLLYVEKRLLKKKHELFVKSKKKTLEIKMSPAAVFEHAKLKPPVIEIVFFYFFIRIHASFIK